MNLIIINQLKCYLNDLILCYVKLDIIKMLSRIIDSFIPESLDNEKRIK